jgi:hypothetical protein
MKRANVEDKSTFYPDNSNRGREVIVRPNMAINSGLAKDDEKDKVKVVAVKDPRKTMAENY